MLERCLGGERSRKLRRAIRKSKVTILCLVLTVVVLRGTIGAGKFGTPKQDLLQIRHRLQTLSHRSINPKNKPRVLLLTGSSPLKPCETPLGQHYLLKSLKNKMEYCRRHGIEISHGVEAMEAELLGLQGKLRIVRSVLVSRPDVELLWWVESDAVFTDMAFEVPWERYADHNVVIHGDGGFDDSAGSFLIRNCRWSLDAIEASLGMAGKLIGEVYFEREHYLRGPVETGMIRPPLVTHFVGCKLCRDFSAQRCLKGMDVAFRIGESQIIRDRVRRVAHT